MQTVIGDITTNYYIFSCNQLGYVLNAFYMHMHTILMAMPTIKHLVISGGGPIGLQFLGAIERLETCGIWSKQSLKSIYGTSIGSVIGAFICIGHDWDTLNKYIIERPWHDSIKVTAKQIFESYYNKGLFDHRVTEVLFKPLLKSKDLDINITLGELYDYSKIELFIYTFELNSFMPVELSHRTNASLRLIDALTMSSALPGIFMPVIIDDKCYIDGGVMCNYPLKYCIQSNCENEILGLKIGKHTRDNTHTITRDSSLLDYIISLTVGATNYIQHETDDIANTIVFNEEETPISLDILLKSISNQTFRKDWIGKGQTYADAFISNQLKSNQQY